MKIRKSIYTVGILVVLSLLALPGCGAVGQLAVQSVLPAAVQSQQGERQYSYANRSRN